MIKHDCNACKKRGQPEKGYRPREPLPERLYASARTAKADPQEASLSTVTSTAGSVLGGATAAPAAAKIRAQEEEGESDV